jgi:hypothetical protein
MICFIYETYLNVPRIQDMATRLYGSVFFG